MKRILYKTIIGVSVVTLTSLTFTGCGKNTIGPSAPESIIQQTAGVGQAVEQDAAEVVQELNGNVADAACHQKNKWSHNLYAHYVMQCNPWAVSRISNHLISQWFGDPDLTKTFGQITASPMFNIVLFRCGVGPLLVLKSLKILSKTWFPGLNTNPKATNPEITLLPYRWKFGQGFYGDRLPGWGNGNGYHLEATTPQMDNIYLETKSLDNNVFMNQTGIYCIWWKYVFYPAEVPGQPVIQERVQFTFYNAYWDRRLRFDSTWIEENNEKIMAQELWASTENKAAVCKIVSQNTDLLNIDLQFDATGVGGGTVDIKSWNGRINHYEFTVKANGHGYYIKNGGRKQRF